MEAEEVNFDGLVGPTHNYAGLSYGNLASMENAQKVSNPKKAALEGLSKMHTLMKMGIKQAVFPPQERPFFPLLHTLGYQGPEDKVLLHLMNENPWLLANVSSASSMWTANAATVSPSFDSQDQRVHFTPANMIMQFHRAFETPTTAHILQRIFNNPNLFAHHFSLPPHPIYSDEGAANHTRFCKSYGEPGVQFFVFGKKRGISSNSAPQIFPARQSEEASRAIMRLHRLNPDRVVFAQQNPEAIDKGVFHNDVISVGNQNVFLFHEKAFADSEKVIAEIQEKVQKHCHVEMHFIKVQQNQISLEEAVKTYFFNSQIITKPDGSMLLVAPQECQQSASVSKFLNELLQTDQPIKQVIYQNVRESMQNGGGPACLRLRIVLSPTEIAAMNPFVLLTPALYENLVEWVNKHYRDRLTLQDLADPRLMKENFHALDELTWILQLGSIYIFQRNALAHRPKDET